MKIYISIPITGRDPKIQQDKAREIVGLLEKLGHETVNPFDIPAAALPFPPDAHYAYCMAACVGALLLCDAAYFDKEWMDSRGCRAEHAIAEIYDKKIFYSSTPIDKIQ